MPPFFDYSHLGLGPGAGSYRESINDVGDALTEIMKRRAEREKFQAVQEQHASDQARLAQQFAITDARQKARDDQTRLNEQAIRDAEKKRFEAEGAAKVNQAFRTEGPEGAAAAGAPYGISLSAGPANTPAAPVAPEAPQAPDRNEIPAVGPLAFMPPELRAMLGRANERMSAVPEPEAPPAPSGPTEPPPFDPSAPPPKEGPKVSITDYAPRVAAYRAEQQKAGEEGYRQQGAQETDFARKAEAFPAAERQYEQDAASYPQRAQAAERARQYTVNLPGGRQGGTLSTAALVDQPREREAQAFRTSQLALLDQQEATAKQLIAAGGPPDVRARRIAKGNEMLADAQQKREHLDRIAASVQAGAETGAGAGKAYESALAEGRKNAQQGEYHLTAEEQLQQRELDRQSRERAAARAAQNSAAGVDVKKMNHYLGEIREAKASTLQNLDVRAMREINAVQAQLADPNGPQAQLAMDGLVKGALGGRATNQQIQNLMNSMGWVKNQEILFYRTTHDGEYPPFFVEAVKHIIDTRAAEADTQKKNTLEALDRKIGLRSRHAADPEMLPSVVDEMKANYTALGVPLPPELGGEAAPGSGAPPPVRPPAGAPAKQRPKKGAATAAHPVDDFLDQVSQ